MDIVRFAGGLGNQMFQYALVEALRNRGRKVKGDLGFYKKRPKSAAYLLQDIFPNICLEYVSDDEFEAVNQDWQKIKKGGNIKEFCDNYAQRFFWVEDISKEPCTYQANIFLTKNCTFVGYWQTEKYFKDIKEILIQRFEFEPINPELRQLGESLSKDSYVSVHVRRGDYLLYPNVYGEICTKDYYLRAINYVREREPSSKFIFFSDDLDWVRENLVVLSAIYCSKDMFYQYEDWYDMYLMSRCRHNIIANSSFSWWGAWLNQSKEKLVITPKKWVGYVDTPDIWCDGWIKI